jgi:hypothetical protein
MEKCAGCGIAAREGQAAAIVAVMNEEDAARSLGTVIGSPSAKGFVAVPVCRACHEDPEHRAVPIKGAFFPRAQARRAVAAAGYSGIQMGG